MLKHFCADYSSSKLILWHIYRAVYLNLCASRAFWHNTTYIYPVSAYILCTHKGYFFPKDWLFRHSSMLNRYITNIVSKRQALPLSIHV